MATTASNKRKKAVAATVAAAALLLAGTFAWTSISQQALNESAGIVNVGGRLHDDFNGENKDVYVENFTDPLNGGQPIFARVKLTEYMEVGQDAGGRGADVDGDGTPGEVEPVVAGTSIDDNPEDWPVHVPEELCAECETGDTCRIHDHWTWTMGGEDQTDNPDGKTTFMPTFNKDKDSLKAEINGTYDGTNPDDKVYYDDYVVYSTADGLTVDMQDTGFTQPEGAVDATPLTEAEGAVTTVTDIAYYDDDTDKEDNDGTRQEKETHTAKETAAAKVITMDAWLALPEDQRAGDFWVYDEDGWAYWANPIMPGQATGLLLDKIEMTKNPGEKCYYAINVVGQFATKGDWEPFELEGGGAPTENGMAVLQAAVDAIPVLTVSYESLETITGITVTDRQAAYRGSTVYLDGYINDEKVSSNKMKYSKLNPDGSMKALSRSSISIEELETASYITVIAESVDYPGLMTSVNIPVKTLEGDYNDMVTNALQTRNSLNYGTPLKVDGISWMAVGSDGAKTLLVATESVKTMAFDSETSGWRTSDVRAWLNGDFFDGLSELKGHVVPSEITSKIYVEGKSTYETTADYVFLVTENDFSSSYKNYPDTQKGTVMKLHYEYFFPETGTGWLRNASSDEKQALYKNGSSVYSASYAEEHGVFPAMWIDMEGDEISQDITANNVDVSTTSATVDAGGTLQFAADVRWNDASADNQKVTWAVEGGREGTSIDETGLLTVSSDEPVGNVLTITATAEEGNDVKGSTTVAVGKVTAITITAEGNATEIIVGEKLQFSASPSLVTWSVSGNESAETKIDENTGLLTMGTTEETKETIGKVLTITATAGDVSATYELTVVDVPEYNLTLTTPDGEILTDTIYSDLLEQYLKVNLEGYEGKYRIEPRFSRDGSSWYMGSGAYVRYEKYVIVANFAWNNNYKKIKVMWNDPENDLIFGEKIFDLKDASERPATGGGE